MQRYELTAGSSAKFWEAGTEDSVLIVRFGRIGTQGQSKTKLFPSAQAAQAERDRLVREKTGKGTHLDIAMAENTLAWMPRALGAASVGQPVPLASEGRHLGGKPRNAIYVTADGKALAVGAIEPQFWNRFCELIGLPTDLRDDSREPQAVRDAVAYEAKRQAALLESGGTVVSRVITGTSDERISSWNSASLSAK